MQITRNEWTPFIQALKGKLTGHGARKMMFGVIGEIQDITMKNFGPIGIARPSEWPDLSEEYAKEMHEGDRTPKLILPPDKHAKKHGGKPQMIDSFVHTFSENGATLTNTAEYADEHLPFTYATKKGASPARPYYPVTFDGTDLTEYAWSKVREVLDAHFSDGI